MRVATLLRKMGHHDCINNHIINDIEVNSKRVLDGDVFIAIKGAVFNGHEYIDEAIKNGAMTIFYEEEIKIKKTGINYVYVNSTKKAAAKIGQIYFNYPTRKLKLIGVTGTNGKTSISSILYHYFKYMGKKVMQIGTNGIFFEDVQFSSTNTTPSVVENLRLIHEARKNKVEYVVMEVSSHAIKELRVHGFDFDVAIFTNLTQDHLDYHKTMTDYKYTKARFLSQVKENKTVILNADDKTFNLYKEMVNANIISYGLKNKCDLFGFNIKTNNLTESKFMIQDTRTHHMFHMNSYLIGEFNIYNQLACIACIKSLGFTIRSVQSFLPLFNGLDGRMDAIFYETRTIIIDYAHTPNGVLSVIDSIKQTKYDKLTVLIGCGGDRDKDKRPKMGKIVTENADKVIFTNDNPRNEKPMDIVDDILNGVTNNNYEVILNRREAIREAIKSSIPKEVILILGKGHEKTQIIGSEKVLFNDKIEVNQFLKEVGLND